MTQLTIEQALKTQNIKFKVNEQQCKIIAKILGNTEFLKRFAISTDNDLNICYWRNNPNNIIHFNKDSREEIELIIE